MPVLTLYKYRVEEMLGRTMDIDELEEWLPWLALDIEDKGPDYIKVEYNPNRPDYGTPHGIMRALKGIMGVERGAPKYKVEDSKIEVHVDQSVSGIRPYILCALVKGVRLREDLIEEIIEFQEDLHMGIGRNRRKMAIGLHDADKVTPPIKYTTVDGSFKFIPLECDSEMSITEILSKHPTGIKYSYVYRGVDRYPIILDSEGIVLSFPPIINGIYTQLSPDTRDIFIDVTGLELNTLMQTINLLTTTLAEYGGSIYSVTVYYPDGDTVVSPSLQYERIKVSIDYIKSLIGVELSLDEITESVEKARLDVSSISDKEIEVVVPPYRVDIMHPVDIVEDVMIGYGLWRLSPTLPNVVTVGAPDGFNVFKDRLSLIMVGLGFQEVMNSVLTNPEEQFVKMNLDPVDYIEVESPKSSLYRILRRWIIPRLMTNLYRSKSEDYPQKIFEIGEVVYPAGDKVIEETHLAAAVAGSKQDYTVIKAALDGFMEAIGIGDYHVVDGAHRSFIPGRVGYIVVGEEEIGIIGEIHPSVILNFQLAVPVAAFEININKLNRILSRAS